VVVINTRAHCWEKHCTSVLVTLASDQPAGENDAEEVHANEEPTLLSTLDLDGVKMHMELRPDVTVKHCVNVFQVHSASLFVPAVGKGIRLMETTSTSGSKCHRRWPVAHDRLEHE